MKAKRIGSVDFKSKLQKGFDRELTSKELDDIKSSFRELIDEWVGSSKLRKPKIGIPVIFRPIYILSPTHMHGVKPNSKVQVVFNTL